MSKWFKPLNTTGRTLRKLLDGMDKTIVPRENFIEIDCADVVLSLFTDSMPSVVDIPRLADLSQH